MEANKSQAGTVESLTGTVESLTGTVESLTGTVESQAEELESQAEELESQKGTILSQAKELAATLEAARRTKVASVKALRDAGKSPEEISELMDLGLSEVYRILGNGRS
ncbi:MAG: hypothetical protein LBT40_01355 [Deltaproteobacteria bacterium]|jgi:hypothetical protein|nr:hypothetical protein [Deltaproteobacteria bacterium]